MSTEDRNGFRYACRYDVCHADDANAAMCKVADVMAQYCFSLVGDVFQWRSDQLCGGQQANRLGNKKLIIGQNHNLSSFLVFLKIEIPRVPRFDISQAMLSTKF